MWRFQAVGLVVGLLGSIGVSAADGEIGEESWDLYDKGEEVSGGITPGNYAVAGWDERKVWASVRAQSFGTGRKVSKAWINAYGEVPVAGACPLDPVTVFAEASGAAEWRLRATTGGQGSVARASCKHKSTLEGPGTEGFRYYESKVEGVQAVDGGDEGDSDDSGPDSQSWGLWARCTFTEDGEIHLHLYVLAYAYAVAYGPAYANAEAGQTEGESGSIRNTASSFSVVED